MKMECKPKHMSAFALYQNAAAELSLNEKKRPLKVMGPLIYIESNRWEPLLS